LNKRTAIPLSMRGSRVIMRAGLRVGRAPTSPLRHLALPPGVAGFVRLFPVAMWFEEEETGQ
jgi:hypothetical protein